MLVSKALSVLLCAAAGLFSVALAPVAVAQEAIAKVGDVVPDFVFGKLLHHDGRMSLREFRGSVVLLQTFGHRSVPCLSQAVPLTTDLQARFGKDGLVCILMESQGLPPDDLLGLMVQRFPQSRAFVTQERPFLTETQTDTIPYSALIGVDGRLLVCGRTETVGRKLEDFIGPEIGKIKKGWGKSPETVKARGLMHGKRALTEADAVLKAADPGDKPERRRDLDDAKAELAAKHLLARRSVESMQTDGRFVDALEAAEAYLKAVKGDPQREKEARELLAYFDREANAKELKADRALCKLTATFRERAPDQDSAAALNKFAEANKGLAVARRAKRLAAAAAYRIK